jgi:hypothetical protein
VALIALRDRQTGAELRQIAVGLEPPIALSEIMLTADGYVVPDELAEVFAPGSVDVDLCGDTSWAGSVTPLPPGSPALARVVALEHADWPPVDPEPGVLYLRLAPV